MTLASWIKATRAVPTVLPFLICAATPALAGPPYITDDPDPTEYGHYEVYLFTNGSTARDGFGGASGIDFNYGALPDLQLTAAIPLTYDAPKGGKTVAGIGNIELAAKYRFLHQEDIGWDVAFFPRVFLPSTSHRVGDDHASVLLPIWVGRDWDDWSTFGGGGCVINRGGASQDYCVAGWALTRQILPDLQIGMEVVHATPDTKGDRASTGIGGGIRYDINENYHLLAYAGPGLQNAAETGRANWYLSILFTF